MDEYLEPEGNLRNHRPSGTSNTSRTVPAIKKSLDLPDRSKPEKHQSSGNVEEISSKPLAGQQKQQKATTREEELVKYMSNLPSYLEKGRGPQQEKVLNVGVLDWNRLEMWQYSSQHRRLSVSSNNNLCSSYASEGEPSPSSSGDQSFSPSGQRMRRPSLQFHLLSSQEPVNEREHGGYRGNGSSQDHSRIQTNTVTEMAAYRRTGKAVSLDPQEMNFQEWKRKVVNSEAQQVVKEKMKSVDQGYTRRPEKMQERKVNVVDRRAEQAVPPKDVSNDSHPGILQCPKSTTILGQRSAETNQRKSLQNSEIRYTVVNSDESESVCSLPHPSQFVQHHTEVSHGRRIVEARECTIGQINAGLKRGMVATPEKIRSTSPFRRLSMGMGKMIGRTLVQKETAAVPQSTSTSKSTNSSAEDGVAPGRETSSCDKRNATSRGRSRSSPLRRLIDPLLKPKATPKYITMESSARDSISTETCHKSTASSRDKSTSFQALLRVAVKNGQPLFTFAVDNEHDILAATVKKFSTSHKDDCSCTYTFFSIQEAKKRNGGWLNQGGKGKGKVNEYVPNVVAQLRASGDQLAREFVLFGVDLVQTEQQQTLDYQPNDELAAIVIKPMAESENFISTTAVLPSGVHSIPTKGGPSSLLQRWRSGGSCDCGGWDLGCKLRVLANNPYQILQNPGRPFELISEGGEGDCQPLFSLTPFKDGIHTVEFHSSLSTLQAFSLCIAVVDDKKLDYNLLEEKATLGTVLAREEGVRARNGAGSEVPAAKYASYPPVSPAGRV